MRTVASRSQRRVDAYSVHVTQHNTRCLATISSPTTSGSTSTASEKMKLAQPHTITILPLAVVYSPCDGDGGGSIIYLLSVVNQWETTLRLVVADSGKSDVRPRTQPTLYHHDG